MANNNDEATREGRRVTLAWVVLALQIVGLIGLLLFARDRLSAMFGAEPAATVAPTAVAAAAEPTADSAATAEPADEPTAEPTDEPAVEPTAAIGDDAGILAPDDVAVDPSSLAPTGGVQAPEWLAQIVQGVPAAEAENGAGIPPHLLLTFRDPQQPELELATPDTIDLNQPQIRIVPITTLLAWLQARGDTAGQEALEELQSLLDEQPPAGEAVVPVPPILSDATQAMVAQMAYGEFHDGKGVGYVAHVDVADATGEDATPITSESGLNYVYQGLSADGRHYVFMTWPMDADFLAEADADELAADPAAYYDAIAAQVEEADDDAMTPALSQLRRVAGSLAIGATAVRAAAEQAAARTQPTAATPAAAAGIVWNWTGSRGGDGDETTVTNPQEYALVFWPDGTFNFMADCNVGRGVSSVAGDGTLSLEPGAMTRAACGPGSQDAEFLQTLPAARALAFDESGDMILTLADGRQAIFANTGQTEMPAEATEPEEQPTAESAGLTGVTLQWPGFTGADGNPVEVENPEDYVVVLLPDGKFTFRADCNVGTGTYTYDAGGALTLVPGAMTRMACPEGSQANEFLSFLTNANGVTLGEDGNPTVTTADGSSATFVNAGPAEAPAEEPATQAAELLNTVWQWTAHVDASATAAAVENPERYTLAFLDDGTYAFVADCNRGAGSYTRDGETLTLLPGAMTPAACEEGSLSDEFIGFFDQIAGFTLEGNGLLLTLADGTALAMANGGPFDATANAPEGGNAAPLAGVTWRWATFRDAKQDYIVPTTAPYTLEFNDDGTVNVVADCNSGSGTYTVNSDGTLTIAVQVLTRAACPPGSLSDSFIEYLNQAGPFAVGDDGVLTIELMADGGTMTFAPEQ